MERLRVEELAGRAEVSVDTIRFYQKRRLLPPPVREGRIAWYGPEHLERLQTIRDLQRRGLSLAVIRRLVSGELDPADEPLAEAVASAVEDAADPEQPLTVEELADRSGVPVALVEAVVREGLLVPHRHDGVARFTTADVAIVAAGLAPPRGRAPDARAPRPGAPSPRVDAPDRGGGRRPLRHLRAPAAAGRRPHRRRARRATRRRVPRRCSPRSPSSWATISSGSSSRSRSSTSSRWATRPSSPRPRPSPTAASRRRDRDGRAGERTRTTRSRRVSASTARSQAMFDRIAPRLRPREPRDLARAGPAVAPADRQRTGNSHAGARVLDIACGTGDLCNDLAAAGHRPVGIDFSAGMLAAARTSAPLVRGRRAAPAGARRCRRRDRHRVRAAQLRRPRGVPARVRAGVAPGRSPVGARRGRARARGPACRTRPLVPAHRPVRRRQARARRRRLPLPAAVDGVPARTARSRRTAGTRRLRRRRSGRRSPPARCSSSRGRAR